MTRFEIKKNGIYVGDSKESPTYYFRDMQRYKVMSDGRVVSALVVMLGGKHYSHTRLNELGTKLHDMETKKEVSIYDSFVVGWTNETVGYPAHEPRGNSFLKGKDSPVSMKSTSYSDRPIMRSVTNIKKDQDK